MREYAKSISQLEDAHAIAQLHQKTMPGDYARVLYKLAQAKGMGNDAAKLDASIKLQDAEYLLTSRRSESGVSLEIEGEAAYDRLVYILWR